MCRLSRSLGIGSVPTLRLQNDFHQAGFAGVEAFEPLRAVGEWGEGADQRGDADRAAGHQLDCPRVFAGRCAAAEQRQLAGDDDLQRERHFGRDVADEADAAAAATERIAV